MTFQGGGETDLWKFLLCNFYSVSLVSRYGLVGLLTGLGCHPAYHFSQNPGGVWNLLELFSLSPKNGEHQPF